MSTDHTRQKQFAATDIDYFLETGLIFKAEGPKSLDHHSRFFTVRADALETAYDLSASLSYSDYSEDSFLINYLGSDFHRDTEGLNLSVNYGQYLGELGTALREGREPSRFQDFLELATQCFIRF